MLENDVELNIVVSDKTDVKEFDALSNKRIPFLNQVPSSSEEMGNRIALRKKNTNCKKRLFTLC